MTEQDILLRIRRKHSEKEAVKILELELSQAKLKIDELTALVAELEDVNAKLRNDNFLLKTKLKNANKGKSTGILFSDNLPEKFKAKLIKRNKQ